MAVTMRVLSGCALFVLLLKGRLCSLVECIMFVGHLAIYVCTVVAMTCVCVCVSLGTAIDRELSSGEKEMLLVRLL